jgi:hypothetical protein
MSDQENNGVPLLTLNRAARLVGVSRGAPEKIKDGELPTFEMVKPEDLLTPIRHTTGRFGSRALYSHQDEAFAHRVRERLLPEPGIAERLAGQDANWREPRRWWNTQDRYTGCTTSSASMKDPGQEVKGIMGPPSCGCGTNWKRNRAASAPVACRQESFLRQ